MVTSDRESVDIEGCNFLVCDGIRGRSRKYRLEEVVKNDMMSGGGH